TGSAWATMEKGATQPGTRSRNCMTRPGLSEYLARGHVPVGSPGVWGPSATTLEYALADSAIGQFAAALGNTAKRDLYFGKAQAWKSLYSNQSGYIHPRNTGGSFKSNFSRSADAGDFVEGNSAQYT